MKRKPPLFYPAIIALLSLIALVSGLMGDGWHDWVAWAGLFLPVAIIGFALARRANG